MADKTTAATSAKTVLARSLKSIENDTTIYVEDTTDFAYPGTCKVNSGTYSEWFSYTGLTATSFTGVVRGLKKKASSSTDNSSLLRKDHAVGTEVVQVTHSYTLNNFLEKDEDGTVSSDIVFSGDVSFTKTVKDPVYANAAARDAAITAPENGMRVYLTAEGKYTKYTAGVWTDEASGTTENASTTVAGKVEQATAAQTVSGTATGETGAKIFSTPADNATVVQNSSWVYAASSAGSDTYAITITPAPTAYATGQKFIFSADVANTGACTLNVNSLGAKALKKLHDQDPEDGDIEAGSIIEVVYDGTNFQIQNPPATIMSKANSVALVNGTAFAPYVSTVTTFSGPTSTTNIDTTITTGFTSGLIILDFKIAGQNAGGNISYTAGRAFYSGTTLKGVTFLYNDLESTGAVLASTTNISSSAPTAGNSSKALATLSISSITSTQIVVRIAYVNGGSFSSGTSSFYLSAWPAASA